MSGYKPSDAADPECGESPSGLHCRHLSMIQHAAINHRDEVCCHCGQKFCVVLVSQRAEPSHGRFLP